MNFAKSLISLSGFLLFFTVVCVFVGSYMSYKDGKIRDKIDTGVAKIDIGVEKIDTIVTNSEKKLNDAGEALSKVNAVVVQNLEKSVKAGEQLEQSYKQIVETLNQTIEGKNATLKAQDEIIGQMTGGNSYPQLSLKKGGFYLTNKGIYSIPNLEISIRSIPNCLEIPREVTLDYLKRRQSNGDYIKPVFYKKPYKLWAGLHIESIDIKNFNSYLPNDNGIMNGFEIYFNSDHKRWVQQIRLISHNGSWEIADILYEIPTTQRDNNFSNQKEIYNHVSENFPVEYPTGSFKIIPFFNAVFDHPTKFWFVPIEYNHKNAISGYSFDSL